MIRHPQISDDYLQYADSQCLEIRNNFRAYEIVGPKWNYELQTPIFRGINHHYKHRRKTGARILLWRWYCFQCSREIRDVWLQTHTSTVQLIGVSVRFVMSLKLTTWNMCVRSVTLGGGLLLFKHKNLNVKYSWYVIQTNKRRKRVQRVFQRTIYRIQ